MIICNLVALQMSLVEQAKEKAATQAVDDYVYDGCRLGVGSGSTVVYAVQHLASVVKKTGYKVTCVPTSFQSRQLILEHGLILSDLSQTPELDVVIDGADEVDLMLNCIKGGGGCQLQEKIVASCGKKFVVIADYRKKSKSLGDQWKKGIPLEVVPMAYVPVLNKLEALGLTAKLRMAQSKAGPVVSDNGNFVLDATFDTAFAWSELEAKLLAIPGIVETGLFLDMAEKAYFGMEDGKVIVVSKPVLKA